MNLNEIRKKADDYLASMRAGIYSPLEAENFLQGMIAVLLCSDVHGALLLAAQLHYKIADMKKAQVKAA